MNICNLVIVIMQRKDTRNILKQDTERQVDDMRLRDILKLMFVNEETEDINIKLKEFRSNGKGRIFMMVN